MFSYGFVGRHIGASAGAALKRPSSAPGRRRGTGDRRPVPSRRRRHRQSLSDRLAVPSLHVHVFSFPSVRSVVSTFGLLNAFLLISFRVVYRVRTTDNGVIGPPISVFVRFFPGPTAKRLSKKFCFPFPRTPVVVARWPFLADYYRHARSSSRCCPSCCCSGAAERPLRRRRWWCCKIRLPPTKTWWKLRRWRSPNAEPDVCIRWVFLWLKYLVKILINISVFQLILTTGISPNWRFYVTQYSSTPGTRGFLFVTLYWVWCGKQFNPQKESFGYVKTLLSPVTDGTGIVTNNRFVFSQIN